MKQWLFDKIVLMLSNSESGLKEKTWIQIPLWILILWLLGFN